MEPCRLTFLQKGCTGAEFCYKLPIKILHLVILHHEEPYSEREKINSRVLLAQQSQTQQPGVTFSLTVYPELTNGSKEHLLGKCITSGMPNF